MVLKAVGFNEGKEGPADVGFGARGEGEGDDETIGRGPDFGEEAGEACAEASGIYDEVTGIPLFPQAAEDGIEIGVGGALPAKAGNDAVDGERWGCGRSGDDIDDGEGGEVVGDRRVFLGIGEGGWYWGGRGRGGRKGR